MTKYPSQPSFTPFTRYVSRAAIVDSAKLARTTLGSPNLPKGPILTLPLDAPLADLGAYFGVTVIDGCDMLFFDVMAGGEYFCTVASAGDEEVKAAMKYWDKTGVMPVWLHTKTGPCGLIRHKFYLHEVYQKAFAASARKDYLSELKDRFNRILEPGVAEAVVASRTGLQFGRVHVAFLGTSKTQPDLTPAH